MVKVLWLLRSPPLPAQEEDLRRFLGRVEIVHVHETHLSPKEILTQMRELGAEEVVVNTLTVDLRYLTQHNVRPLWPEMKPVRGTKIDPDRDVKLGNTWYRFTRFRRVQEINVKFTSPYHLNVPTSEQQERRNDD